MARPFSGGSFVEGTFGVGFTKSQRSDAGHPQKCTNPYGRGSKLNQQGTTGFTPWFHLPGFHFGYIF